MALLYSGKLGPFLYGFLARSNLDSKRAYKKEAE